MGAKFIFACGTCRYSAEVSGGWDRGIFSITQTISCAACKKLYDVEIGDLHGSGVSTDAGPSRARKPECPEDPTHPVKAWGPRGKCPRCGGKMAAGPMTALWD
jgi:hypothetical protein